MNDESNQPRFVPAALMVGLGRIELPTSRLSGARSNHLSYRPHQLEVALHPDPAAGLHFAFYGNVRRRSKSPGIDLGVNAVTASP